MASLKVRINFKKVKKLQRQLDDVDDALLEISHESSQAALRMIEKGFQITLDPYGATWAPLKRPRRGGKVLSRTKAMRRSFRPGRVTKRGFTIRTGVGYAGFHQNGKGRMSRKMIPDEGRPSPRWKKRFERIARKTLREHFR